MLCPYQILLRRFCAVWNRVSLIIVAAVAAATFAFISPPAQCGPLDECNKACEDTKNSCRDNCPPEYRKGPFGIKIVNPEGKLCRVACSNVGEQCHSICNSSGLKN